MILLLKTVRDLLAFSVEEGEGFNLSAEPYQIPVKSTLPKILSLRVGKTKHEGKSVTRGQAYLFPTQSHSLQRRAFQRLLDSQVASLSFTDHEGFFLFFPLICAGIPVCFVIFK